MNSRRRVYLALMLCCTMLNPLLAAAEPPAAHAESFQRCAACHLTSGEGVLGAFPPLKDRIADIAASPEGRNYLVAVINTGLMGSITIDGVPYMGVMPAQGASYDAGGIRDALNYSVQILDSENVAPQWQPFTTEEVATIIKAVPPTSSTDNARLRQALYSRYPNLP